MQELHGQSDEPFLMLHGGAGPQDPSRNGLRQATEELLRIARDTLSVLTAGQEPITAVVKALGGMEASPEFNAGFGSAMQSDGQTRLTASLMDGTRQSFSGVISLSFVKHPSRIAEILQQRRSRVLTGPGHELVARELGLPPETLVTDRRLDAWLKYRNEESVGSYDTVGAVVWTSERRLAAGSSTGGRGGEFPGRVSDSGTVAGNYASSIAAITCTGIGEQIVDDAVAARIETRRRDGLSLAEASHRTFEEGVALGREYGWVSLDEHGYWAVAHTTPAMTFVVMTESGRVLASSLPD